MTGKHRPRRDWTVPRDHRGRYWCTCGRPEDNVDAHETVEVGDDVRQAEARRYGEHDDQVEEG